MTKKLAHYLNQCKRACLRNDQYVSISSDKSRVHSLGLQNTLVCLGDGVAFWAAPHALSVWSTF